MLVTVDCEEFKGSEILGFVLYEEELPVWKFIMLTQGHVSTRVQWNKWGLIRAGIRPRRCQ